MAKKWTKASIDKFIEDNGGEGFALIDVFPFSVESLEKIGLAYSDEDNYTDSDLVDLIIELAYKEVA